MNYNDDPELTEQPPNIWRWCDNKGIVHYTVCEWVPEHNKFRCPMNKRERHITGCTAWIGKHPRDISSRDSLSQCRYQARKLYGYSKLAQSIL